MNYLLSIKVLMTIILSFNFDLTVAHSEGACEDYDTEIRALSFGTYNSCWQAVLLSSEKCNISNEGTAQYPYFYIGASCRLSCGHCKKDEKDKDIVDIIHSHKNLTTLAIAIANANFIPQLRNQKENFTIFAPHNDAFHKELWEMIINNHTATFDLLSRHKVVGHGRFTTDRIDRGLLITVNNHGKGLIEIWRNGTTDALTAVERPGNNPFATIIERDISASNGVIHILDGIL